MSLSLSEAIIDEQLQEEICISKYARSHLMLNTKTHEVKVMNCKSWRCPKHRKSWLQKWRIIVSRETAINPINKLITLTCASEGTPQQLCRARQLFFRDWRKANGSIEYFSVLEFTSQSRLPHLHILARGNYFRQKTVSALWASATAAAGFAASPIVYIEKPRSQQAASIYALSYALSGHSKGQDIPENWSGRKITYSKGFFRAASTEEHWHNWIAETFGEDKPENWTVISKLPSGKVENYIDFLTERGLI